MFLIIFCFLVRVEFNLELTYALLSKLVWTSWLFCPLARLKNFLGRAAWAALVTFIKLDFSIGCSVTASWMLSCVEARKTLELKYSEGSCLLHCYERLMFVIILVIFGLRLTLLRNSLFIFLESRCQLAMPNWMNGLTLGSTLTGWFPRALWDGEGYRVCETTAPGRGTSENIELGPESRFVVLFAS